MNKYILYARKSTEDEERQILSITAQVTEAREFAQKEGIEIAEILTESKTAKIPGRLVFNRMTAMIETGQASGILSWHPDRLARNAVDAGKIIHLLDTGKLLDLKFPSFLFQKGIRSRGGKPFHKNVIKVILSNPFYYGHFHYGGEIHEGKHQPIITKKLWDRVQEVMTSKCWHRKENHKFPFVGLMKCGECGYMITAEQKVKHYKKNCRTQIFTYYRCSKKNPRQKCYQPFVRQAVVVSALRNKIKYLALPSGWAKRFLEKIEEEKKGQKNQTGIFVQEKEEKMKLIGGKIDRLLDSHLDNTITREEFLKKKSQLLSEKRLIEEEIFNLQRDKNSWPEPFHNYVLLCQEAENLSCTKAFYPQMTDLLKRSGSDLTLKDRRVSGNFPEWRPLLRPRPQSYTWASYYDLARTFFQKNFTSNLANSKERG